MLKFLLRKAVVEPGIAASAAALSLALTADAAHAPVSSQIFLATTLSTAALIVSPATSLRLTWLDATSAWMASARIVAESSKLTLRI